MEPLHPPALHFVAELCAAIGHRAMVEQDGPVLREFTPVSGGTLIGPNIEASVQPGGGDWSTNIDGIFRLDARYPVLTNDGVVIEVYNRGVGHSDEAIFEEITAKGGASLDQTYFRTLPQFFTSSEKYKWLSTKAHIGVGRFVGSEIIIHFYEIG
ncbi:hypothetical protein ABIC78_003779 [Novosphingobium sp. 1529]|uniref:DUF3237 domain-containing protein n=1 Tax=Novosphingobium sp. 1529 TaxID=3156424 RepID=UPI00145A22D0